MTISPMFSLKSALALALGLGMTVMSFAGETLNPHTGKLDIVPTIEEADGSPSGRSVTKIVLPNGTLSVSGSTATYTPGSSGSSVKLDIGDDGGDDSTAITEIATSGDTNSIVSEPADDKLLINMGNDWPKADTADDLTCTNCIGATEIDGASLESEIEAVADLQDFQGAVTDSQVPNSITIDLAATATALAANGDDCSAGSAPIGVNASGAAESCTDYEEDLSNSAGLAGALSDETGSGVAVFGTSPTIGTPIITGKIDRNDSAVDDDDCTGEQGIYWYDTTDSRFEFCDANTGTPTALGGGSSTFLDLTDTPSDYTGAAGNCVVVNGTEDGVEFDTCGGGSGTPAGSDTQVQFNNAGAFGAESAFTWNATDDILTTGLLAIDGVNNQIRGVAVGATSSGNGVRIQGGNGGATSGNGANVVLDAGNSQNGGGAGGSLLLSSGDGHTTGKAGPVELSVGSSGNDADGEYLALFGGWGQGTGRNGGEVQIWMGGATDGTNGPIVIYDPNGQETARFTSDGLFTVGAAGLDGALKIYSEQGATDYYTQFQPGTQTQDVTYTLPNDDGASGDVLRTNGSGTLSWGAGGKQTRCFTITGATTASDFGNVFRFSGAVTLNAVHCLAVGGTNVVGQLQECDSSGANCADVDSDMTCTAGSNVNDDGSLTNPSIDSGDYLGVKTTSVSGTNTNITWCYEYTVT